MKIVVPRDDGVERMIKVAVRVRGIPCYTEVLIGGIPLKEIGVTEHFPAVGERTLGEVLGKSFADGMEWGETTNNEQTEQTQIFFHD